MKLTVCIILPKLQIGGAEMHVMSLLKQIDPARFAVSLMCLSPGNERMEEEARRHVESFVTVRFRWRRCLVSLAAMTRFLRAGRFDVVHCHLPPADTVGRIAARLAGVPVILTTEHGKFLWKPWYYLAVERMLGTITDARICVSRDIMEIRKRREGTPERKLVYIPNAVDTVRFGAPSRDRATAFAELGWDAAQPLVVAVGRLEPEKNYALLLRAIDRLRPRFPAIRCLLVGDGTCRAALAGLVESLGLARNVTLAGARADIPDLLGAADVFVLSSIKEGLPVSLLEAMAAGKGIVATAVGGIPETIRDGGNGLLVPSGDVEALAGGIARLLADEGLRTRLGRSARADVERDYDVRKIVGRIESLYEETYRKKAKA
jgi:glycosyltransferase involved in cell wall biosynthesis